ncbi:MAG: zinc-ribbon domain containing protein [Clostridia bacterium]|nr:zinc-ribbon domain containing protein [Clostridia bacterium]
MFEDKTLICKECGNEFIFSAGEQEFYAEKGFENDPIRCKECRAARKRARNPERTYYDAVCAECGGPARIPFEPKDGRPVYCSACHAKRQEEAE